MKKYKAKDSFLGMLKLICWVMIYFVIQSIISGVWMAIKLMGTIDENFSFDFNKIVSLVTEDAMAITAVCNVVFILVVIISIRHKGVKLTSSLYINKFSPKIAIIIAITAVLMNFSISILWDYIPFPESNLQISDMINNIYESTSDVIFVISGVIIAPIAEELLLRRLTYRCFGEKAPFAVAMIFSSAIFGAIHGSLYQGTYAFLLGLALYFIFVKTKSLLASIEFHMMFNLMACFNIHPENLPDYAYISIGVAGIIISALLLTLVNIHYKKKEDS